MDQQEAHQLVGAGKYSATKIWHKAIGGSIFNFDKCRPKVADNVISGMALYYVGMDVRTKFGNSRLNCGQTITLWPVGRVLRSI